MSEYVNFVAIIAQFPSARGHLTPRRASGTGHLQTIHRHIQYSTVQYSTVQVTSRQYIVTYNLADQY